MILQNFRLSTSFPLIGLVCNLKLTSRCYQPILSKYQYFHVATGIGLPQLIIKYTSVNGTFTNLKVADSAGMVARNVNSITQKDRHTNTQRYGQSVTQILLIASYVIDELGAGKNYK